MPLGLDDRLTTLAGIALGCLRFGFINHVRLLMGSFVVGAVLAVLCWFGAVHYTRLWNRGYRVTTLHHLLCGFAACMTFAATVTYAGLAFLGDYGRARVQLWHEAILTDQRWNDETFQRAYRDVRALGLEDFAGYPPPPAGRVIPATLARSQEVAARRYAGEALAAFRVDAPWLAAVLSPATLDPRDSLRADIRRFFSERPHDAYPTERATQLVARLISADLIAKTPRLVVLGRGMLAFFFVLAQALAFAAIGFAAYRDIKVHV